MHIAALETVAKQRTSKMKLYRKLDHRNRYLKEFLICIVILKQFYL